jgi:hypothetical protein
MDNERSQSWKDFTIETCVFPVSHWAAPWRWPSVDEAPRQTVEDSIHHQWGCRGNRGSSAQFVG